MEFTVDIDPKHEDALREWAREHGEKLFLQPGDLVQFIDPDDKGNVYLITDDGTFYSVTGNPKRLLDVNISSSTYSNGTKSFKLLYRRNNDRV